ncbi:hypothetical protein Egran_04078 [Elaphomyces granulatus]|uniref:Uncharacterized protein n=1 Tax=Elaphomyces granulatus TaxID=519963 RepID=A0A232LVJ0_9EURO|nr:hypothetical protein Egran_04078 [Elaphomyces granulatus]
MAFNVPEPLPPTTILSSKAISQSAAQDFLAAYLDRAATDPSLQPNATISEHGPVSRTTGAPNLTLHTLKRVQAGLAGQVLGQDLSLQAHHGGRRFASERTGDEDDADINANGQGWEDRRRFEVAPEDDDDEDVGATKTQFDFEKEAVIQVNEDGMPISSSGKIDKEERKRKKKERRQAEKRAKAEVMEDDDRP